MFSMENKRNMTPLSVEFAHKVQGTLKHFLDP